MNGNVRLLIFILLVEDTVDIDKFKIESDFSQLKTEPLIFIKVLKNKLIVGQRQLSIIIFAVIQDILMK